MSNYPLTVRSMVFGLAAGFAAAILTASVLVGYALFAGCAVVGMTWRRDEPPVMPFILFFQWVQVTIGYFYFRITGVFPDLYMPGALDLAVGYGLTGLLLLAGGIRTVAWVENRRGAPERIESRVLNLRALLWIVIILFSINYLGVISGGSGGALSVVIDRALQLRQIPLLLLWMEVIRQGRNKSYLWLSLVFVFVPQLGSYYSDFKTPLMLMGIVFAFFWRPWNARRQDFTLRAALRVIAVGAAVVFLAMIWQGGVKREIRRAYDVEAVSSNPIDRVQLFLTHAETALPVVFNDTGAVVEDLVSRLSYVTFFSRVLEHVPQFEPHARGELLTMAMSNAFVPRFLAPDKAVLPSDSYYTRRFAGVMVTESNTSISIGYMAEFYADWGMFGMFASVFAYGVIMGLATVALRRLCPQYLANAAIVSAMLVVLPFEHQFIKGFAALLLTIILTVVVTRFFGSALAQHIGIASEPYGQRPDVAPARVDRPAARTINPVRRPV